MPKDADPDWEVVTVKPGDLYAKGDHIDVNGRHVTLENETVEILLLIGYNVQKNQLVGAPDWVKTERWNVDGLAERRWRAKCDAVAGDDTQGAGRTIRAGAAPGATRDARVCASVAKGGPKLTANTSDPNGLPNQRGKRGEGWQMYTYTNASMPELALMLLSSVDRPIVDQTGLKGRYDFQLKWLTDDIHAADPDAPPGIFTAIQEQIGLKLEPVKAPADVLVIDKVERPGAN